MPCREECTPLGASLQGVLPNENLLGITLMAAMPFAFLGFRGAARYGFCAYLAAMAVATTSRTATGAAVVVLVALLVVRPRLDGPREGLGRTAFAAFCWWERWPGRCWSAEHRWDNMTLTNRPTLWHVASGYIERSPWFGYGPEKWATLYESSEIPRAAQRTAHNQWMDVLVVAGIVGAVLLVVLLAVMIWSAGAALPGILIAMAAVFLVGTTEGAWAIGYVDLLSFSLLALLLTGPVAPEFESRHGRFDRRGRRRHPLPFVPRAAERRPRDAARPRLDIVIVNWNAGAYLDRMRSSGVRGTTDREFELSSVTVVDNASTDELARAPAMAIDVPLELVATT